MPVEWPPAIIPRGTQRGLGRELTNWPKRSACWLGIGGDEATRTRSGDLAHDAHPAGHPDGYPKRSWTGRMMPTRTRSRCCGPSPPVPLGEDIALVTTEEGGLTTANRSISPTCSLRRTLRRRPAIRSAASSWNGPSDATARPGLTRLARAGADQPVGQALRHNSSRRAGV